MFAVLVFPSFIYSRVYLLAKLLEGANKHNACVLDINLCWTPLGQVRQFIEPCGTQNPLFWMWFVFFGADLLFMPRQPKKNTLWLLDINEYLTSSIENQLKYNRWNNAHNQYFGHDIDPRIYGVTIWVEKKCIEKFNYVICIRRLSTPRKTFGQENSIKRPTAKIFKGHK